MSDITPANVILDMSRFMLPNGSLDTSGAAQTFHETDDSEDSYFSFGNNKHDNLFSYIKEILSGSVEVSQCYWRGRLYICELTEDVVDHDSCYQSGRLYICGPD